MDDEGDEKDDTKRRTRNLSEKKRRDQFNMLVNELSAIVSTNNRKMDKSTILKTTISFLKNHNELTVRSKVHDIQNDWKPGFLSNEEFTYLILEALEGFIMVFSATGRICYVSESVTPLLGYKPFDLMNKTIFDFTSDEDRPNLYNLLQNPGNSGHTLQGTTLKEKEIMFQCHLKRGSLDFQEQTNFELIQFNGYYRNYIGSSESGDVTEYGLGPETRLLLVCTGRLSTPQLLSDVSLIDSSSTEFTSRHSLEWKFLFLDHRAQSIIGYMPFEVLGTSGYDYYHFDDLEKVVRCHEALMEKGELTSCYYRFLTKGQQWIWLQTRFYITYHQWNAKPEFVVCTHRVVSYSDLSKNTKQGSVEMEEIPKNEPANVDNTEATPKEALTAISPTYMSETSDPYIPEYQPPSKLSVKSVSGESNAETVATAAASGTSWSRGTVQRYGCGSDTTSFSGDSRSSHHQSSRDLCNCCGKDQLQRKHEELKQLIVRQQEELRHVKEQLLLAHLGILPPFSNVPGSFMNTVTNVQSSDSHQPLALMYETSHSPQRLQLTNYPAQQPPHGNSGPQ